MKPQPAINSHARAAMKLLQEKRSSSNKSARRHAQHFKSSKSHEDRGKATSIAPVVIRLAEGRGDQDSSSASMSGHEQIIVPAAAAETDSITQMRAKLISHIEKKFESSGIQDKSMNHAAMARKLEAHLFATAVSFEEYQDPATLNDRFAALLGQLLRRRLQKAENARAMASNDPRRRLQLLSMALEKEHDPDKVSLIFFLVRQIEHLQVGKPLSTSTERTLGEDADVDGSDGVSQQRSPSIASFNRHLVATGTGARACPKATKFHMGGQQRLPPAVKGIFFDAAIVDAFYRTPAYRLGDVPWTQLIAKSEKDIRAYHCWLDETKS